MLGPVAEGKHLETNSLEVCPTSRQHALVFVGESSLPHNFALTKKAVHRPAFDAQASITLIVSSAHAFVVSQSKLPARKDTKMEATKVDVICINQMELAARWRISHRTLERWRWTGEGPKFLKVGGRVVYRLTDIEEYEEMMIRSSTSGVRDAHQFSA
ncbi:helix-turn-helix transcriptional regulator [Rhodocista pekingensis]|uniref:Helix-turn-helix transcriptional regulator n=2 Tax=Alphaproteobacteria TaxID=28211 RepID=A0ABW2KUV6_9PROT